MIIFSNKNGKLTKISEVQFKLEKDIQKLVEDNMKNIFGIDFITSEFIIGQRRIDSLGFDQESKSFVIIEYKRDKNSAVSDQGLTYLSLLLHNKAEFVLAHNENTGNILKKNDIDWSQSKVIFISTSFTDFHRESLGFKDLPIELWKVKQYHNETISFTKIESHERVESITKISSKSELVRSVSKEVKTYDEDFHLHKCDEYTKLLYRQIKDEILSIANNITLKPKKKYIAFIHKTNFVDIVTQKSSLKVFINMNKDKLNDPKNLARDISQVGHWGNGDYEIQIKNVENLGYIMSLIRQSYEKN